MTWGGPDDWRQRRRGEKASCRDEDPKRYLFSGLIVIAVTVTLGGLLVSAGALASTALTYLIGMSFGVVVRAVWRETRRKKCQGPSPSANADSDARNPGPEVLF